MSLASKNSGWGHAYMEKTQCTNCLLSTALLLSAEITLTDSHFMFVKDCVSRDQQFIYSKEAFGYYILSVGNGELTFL